MPQKKYDAFDHAGHNLKVHQSLANTDFDCSDWEITTAFYSALKFFEGSLFPDTLQHPDPKKGQEYFESYNAYKSAFNRFVGGSPHDCLKRLVRANTADEIWQEYKTLYDLCHTSRYSNYQVEQYQLEIAKNSLHVIRIYCVKNQKS